MLGDTLVNKGIITTEQLEKALAEQKKSGDKLGDVIVRFGFTTHEQIENALK
jgi:type IV pilus assembly protein PilB